MIFMPLEPLANEAIQVHSILCANITRNNAIIKYNKTDDRLFTFVEACIPNGFVAVTNLLN